MSARTLRLLVLSLALSAVMGSGSAVELASDIGQLRTLRAEALALEHGEGVARNPELAAQKYCQAAKLGDAEAQYSLGWMYANGRGIKRDDALAAYFFALAASGGHAHGERMLRYVGTDKADAPDCMREAPAPVAAEGGLLFENPTPDQQKVLDLVHRLAPQYGVVPRLALAVIRAESNFDPLAISTKNAQGLMQLIPDTAVRFNVRKPFDPEQNIRGGLAYLRWLLAYFKGDVVLVAAAYNAGEGAVNRFRGVPPFAETRDYVKRIREIFRQDDHPYDPAVTEPSPELPRIRLRRM